MAVTLNNSQWSAGLYSAFWNRAPDATGQNFWVGKLNSGETKLSVATAFYNAPEGLAAYPNWIRSDNAALVTQAYNSIFQRAPDAAGKAFWVAQLNSGVSFPQVVLNMVQSAVDSAAAGNTDGQQFLNEIQVGIYVSETLRTDDPAITSVAFDGVTYQESSVAIREAQLQAMANAGQTYTLTSGVDTLSPTSPVAATQTTPRDDLIRAPDTNMLNTADYIDAGNGIDTLQAALAAGTTANFVAPTLKSVEVIKLNVDASASTATNLNSTGIDLVSATGVEKIVFNGLVGHNATQGTVDVQFKNVAIGVVSEISGGTVTNSTGGAANATVSFVAAATTGTADSATVNLSNVATVGTLTVNEIETLTLTSLEAEGKTASIATLADNALKTLNINGAAGTISIAALGDTDKLATVNVTGNAVLKTTFDANASLQDNLKTVDMSTSAGANEVYMKGSYANVTVKGGTGAETIKFDNAAAVASAVGTTGAVTGGAGKDTLAVGDLSFDAAAYTNLNKATEFEVLGLTGASTNAAAMSVDMSKLFGNEVSYLGSGLTAGAAATNAAAKDALTFTNVENTDSFVFAGNVKGGAASTDTAGNVASNAVQFNVKSDDGANVLNLTLKGSATVASTKISLVGGKGATNNVAGADAINASTIETINLVSLGKNDGTATTFSSNANAIAGGAGSATTDPSGASIEMSANGKIIITGEKDLDLGTVKATNVTIDASTGFTGGITVTTGDGNDIIKGGATANVINAGAGNDSITGGAGNDSLTGGNGKDTVNGLAGDDVIYAAGSSSTTVSDADVLTGGTGKDTFFVSVLHSTPGTNTANSIDSITDFVAATDLIKIGGGTVATNAVYNVTSADTSSAADIIAAITIANAAVTSTYGATVTANDVIEFTYGGKTYAFMNEADSSGFAVEAGDAIVDITGVSGTLTKADFFFNAS